MSLSTSLSPIVSKLLDQIIQILYLIGQIIPASGSLQHLLIKQSFDFQTIIRFRSSDGNPLKNQIQFEVRIISTRPRSTAYCEVV